MLTFIGCFIASMALNREVSLTNDGLPSLFSMYRAETPVPNLAVYTPTANSVIPAAWYWKEIKMELANYWNSRTERGVQVPARAVIAGLYLQIRKSARNPAPYSENCGIMKFLCGIFGLTKSTLFLDKHINFPYFFSGDQSPVYRFPCLFWYWP